MKFFLFVFDWGVQRVKIMMWSSIFACTLKLFTWLIVLDGWKEKGKWLLEFRR